MYSKEEMKVLNKLAKRFTDANLMTLILTTRMRSTAWPKTTHCCKRHKTGIGEQPGRGCISYMSGPMRSFLFYEEGGAQWQ